MKTKTFLIGLLLCIFFPCTLFSQFLFIDNTNWSRETERSISSTPILEQEGDVITIYSDEPLEDFTIEFKDFSGTIISQTVITIPAETTYSIDITDLASSDYTIRISQGNRYIIGYFNK